MVKNLKQKSSPSLTTAQKQELSRIARKIVKNLKETTSIDSWDPVSRIEETPIVDVIPCGHVIVRSGSDRTS